MAAYLIAEDLGFGMASPERYRKALVDAGFVDVILRNRHAWYLETAREELRQLERVDRARFDAAVGADEVDRQIRTWRAMVPVLESGEHCPHHLRGHPAIGLTIGRPWRCPTRASPHVRPAVHGGEQPLRVVPAHSPGSPSASQNPATSASPAGPATSA